MNRATKCMFLFMVVCLALSGCAPQTTPPKTETPAAPAEPAPQPRTLIISFPADPPSLNPITESGDYAQAICNNIFDKLVMYDSSFTVQPALAKSWKIHDDMKTITFTLESGVKWHDGTAFTSKDVKYSLETAKAIGATKSRLQDIEAVETPDDHTVIIRLSNPSGVIMGVLAWGSVQIIPKHLYEGTNFPENPYNRKPIGTGPFKFVEWKPGEHIMLEANEDYFKGPPEMSKVVFKIIPQVQTALAALQSGEIHALSQYSNPPFRDLTRLEQDPNLKVIKWNHYTFWRLAFNFNEKPFDDVRVRRAFAHAIDREKIVETCYAGVPQAAKHAGPLSPAVAWAYNKDAPDYPYDPAKAEALLEEAGFKKDASGVRLKCTLDFVDYLPGDKDMWLMIRDMLAKVGIQAELKQYDAAAWNDKVYKQKDFQTSFAGTGGPDPDILRYMFETDGSGNPGSYSNKELDALLQQAYQHLDPEARKPLYYKIQEVIATDLPSIPIWNLVLAEVWNKDYVGREGYSMYFATLYNIKYVGK